MSEGNGSKTYEWEWRDEEYARRRERARVIAHRRGRLRLAALVAAVAVVTVSAVFAVRAVALPAPCAGERVAHVLVVDGAGCVGDASLEDGCCLAAHPDPVVGVCRDRRWLAGLGLVDAK